MASGSPATLERRAGQSAAHSGFPHASIPRARFAADPAHGAAADAKAKHAWERDVSDAHDRRVWERRAALEKHCAFFDRDNDGVIWPHDTFLGLYALGFGLVISFVATFIIHTGLSWFSGDGWIPDPFFRFRIHNAHKCKHGSDSQTYDTEGRFTPQKVCVALRQWRIYSSDPAHGYLTIPDTMRMLKGNRIIVDPFGWFSAAFEWGSLWYLLWPKDRRMKREDVRAVYTGDLFYRIAHERKQGKARKHRHAHHAQTNGVNGASHSH
ncbi:Caleosin-domain-containing protein [Auricularia subglabra TFB-10046 SS5]|nr:Caleosin-domain-containing protein [Auricularia subglabra TFB-10046 SS5]